MNRFVGFVVPSLAFALALATSSWSVGCSSEDVRGQDPLGDGAVDTTSGDVSDTGHLEVEDPDAHFDVKDPEVLTEIGPDGSCGGTTINATARDASLLLVIDKSGSMLQKPAGFSVKKWDALKTSLAAALGKAKTKMSLGLELFPYDPVTPIEVACVGNCCSLPSGSAAITVPIESGPTAAPKILAAIDATSPGGATPTAEALKRAVDYYTTGAGKDVKGDKYVLLATDGGPNCNTSLTCDADHCTKNLDGTCGGGNCCDSDGGSKIDCLDDAEVTTQLGALKTAGVKTFIVGIPGSEVYNKYLDAFAVAGGITSPAAPPKYFAVNAAGDVASLTSVFELITGALITTCRLQLEKDPPDVSKLNVYVDGKLIPQGGPDGWELDTSTSPATVVLKGATCESMTTKGAKVVSIDYGCPTVK